MTSNLLAGLFAPVLFLLVFNLVRIATDAHRPPRVVSTRPTVAQMEHDLLDTPISQWQAEAVDAMVNPPKSPELAMMERHLGLAKAQRQVSAHTAKLAEIHARLNRAVEADRGCCECGTARAKTQVPA